MKVGRADFRHRKNHNKGHRPGVTITDASETPRIQLTTACHSRGCDWSEISQHDIIQYLWEFPANMGQFPVVKRFFFEPSIITLFRESGAKVEAQLNPNIIGGCIYGENLYRLMMSP